MRAVLIKIAALPSGLQIGRMHDDRQIQVNPFASAIGGRRDQAFPTLTEADISRGERFGERRQYRRVERLFAAGDRTPGMFLVLKGALTMTARDGLGRTAQVVRHGPGQSTGEVAQLSTGVAVVDADADDDVEALLIPPERVHALIVAEAELGERIVRALILRRVADIESGGSGPVLIGDLQSPDMLRLGRRRTVGIGKGVLAARSAKAPLRWRSSTRTCLSCSDGIDFADRAATRSDLHACLLMPAKGSEAYFSCSQL